MDNKTTVISGRGFSNICDFIYCNRYTNHFDYDFSKIEENKKVFLNLDLFEKFLQKLKENPPKNKFILITHNSDSSFSDYHYNSISIFVNKIYALNNICNKSNVFTIPIGYRDFPIHLAPIHIYKNPLPISCNKTTLCVFNSNVGTNSNARNICNKLFTNKTWVLYEGKVNIARFSEQLQQSKYVISPRGAGIDCHRTYEGLYYNCIPIILSCELNQFYSKMPILIIDNWNCITQNYLEDKYIEYVDKLMKWKESNQDWMKASFWISKEW
jgi:hypothetical protein